VRACLALLGRG